MEIEKVLYKSTSKRLFRHRIHSSLKRAHARRGRAGIIYHIDDDDVYCQFSGQATLLRSAALFVGIIIRDSYFNLMNKYNLIGRLNTI